MADDREAVPKIDLGLITEAISASRLKLAASMIEPLRARRDYQSVGRKTFLVEDLPVPCESCGATDPNAGADAGCPECVARHVIET